MCPAGPKREEGDRQLEGVITLLTFYLQSITVGFCLWFLSEKSLLSGGHTGFHVAGMLCSGWKPFFRNDFWSLIVKVKCFAWVDLDAESVGKHSLDFGLQLLWQ